MKISLFGCTGFIGKSLTRRLLDDGHHIHLFTRKLPSDPFISHENLKFLEWDGKSIPQEAQLHVQGADAIVNLSGEGVAAKRWSEQQKKRIRESRLHSTKAIVDTLKSSENKPRVFINASAIGYYGDVPEDKDVLETTAAGSGFLASTCADWEEEAKKIEGLGIRLVLLRIGVVLEKGGGALSRMIPPFQMFIGGPLGSGKQWFPWVHRDDIVGMIQFALEREELSGAVNAVSPNPLQLKAFCTELGKAMNRPSWAPVPAFVLKVLLGEMSTLLLTGQKVIPKKATDAGYQFQYPTASEALKAILK